MGIGKGFGAFGVFIVEYQHRRAGASDFGGHLRFGRSPRASGSVQYFEQKGGVALIYQRRRFEVAVFDEARFFHQNAKKPLALGGYGGGAVGGKGGLQDLFRFRD
jgi:hypothetical protein